MNDLFAITGKTALITGATSGMGKAIAELMGLHGAAVVAKKRQLTFRKKESKYLPSLAMFLKMKR
jgi:NAD(P)-dependent dehydrogenase (short-subunit alcohol dehydrogenase family)